MNSITQKTLLQTFSSDGDRASCAAYLYNTVSKFEELGIHDRKLWKLRHLVADKIKRIQTTRL
jgi:cation transport regulator ChaC